MDRIRLPTRKRKAALDPKRKPEPRDELARPITTMTQLGAFVHDLRTGLAIGQSELAMRADVGRQWIGELEQGKPSLEAEKVLRVLLTLGFELVLSPYDPPPPWMLRACAFAAAHEKVRADARRASRTSRRERARVARLAANSRAMVVDLE